jgi:hypothetical protein
MNAIFFINKINTQKQNMTKENAASGRQAAHAVLDQELKPFVTLSTELNKSMFFKDHGEDLVDFDEDVSKKKKKTKSSKTKALAPSEALAVLVRFTSLKDLKVYNTFISIYLCRQDRNYYIKITEQELSDLVIKIFSRIGLPPFFYAYHYIESFIKCTYSNPTICKLGGPNDHIDKGLVIFTNGTLDVVNNRFYEQEYFSERFVVGALDYEYDPLMATPAFDAYLEDVSGGNEDRKNFLLTALYQVIRFVPDLHIFFYFYGLGGTGKTTFTSLASALVGDLTTHVTNLRAISTDPFEAVNILDKKLVIIGDTDAFKDVGNLKALTGGDAIRGRVMYSSATKKVYLQGTLMITANHLLDIRDSSGAIMRRIRPFKFHKASFKKETLLIKYQNTWQGLFVQELPGIYARVMSTRPEDIDKYLRNYSQLEAVQEEINEVAEILNPLLLFVKSCIMPKPDGGTFVVGALSEDKKQQLIDRTSKLYRVYIYLCQLWRRLRLIFRWLFGSYFY